MTIRLTWKRVIVSLLGIFAFGMAFAWSGIFNVAASSGHWAISNWFLHWVMRNSVRTHAAISTPETIIDRGGMVSAAGHFAQACASCHGAPGVRPLPVMQRATPHAPDLSVNAREWSDRQLFWILRHGVKFSGMPAWGADGRDDEIRRMVAFVRALPTMTPARYRALVAAPVAPASLPAGGAALVARCTGCHGTDGRGRGQGDIPILAGQRVAALEAALRAYRASERDSAVMQQAAATLDDTQISALARHFAAKPGLEDRPAAAITASRSQRRAQQIVERGVPRIQLPACASCHAPGKPQPILTGQRASYIAARLRHWKGDGKENDARQSQAIMPVIARRIPEEMIDPVARYLAGSGR
ncbi:Cytochrome c553 [Sphingomonas palmae]|uniref:Cytochrome c553 n=1 Tax=Sphingomonas palmae TaxID=1855283 RepID=A0A1H7TVS6_9SPHN|nr:c-type cytochrome [Sphingomonas palmae]SEL88037.1 Cytochrome c553 [Sphingomonas palmae]